MGVSPMRKDGAVLGGMAYEPADPLYPPLLLSRYSSNGSILSARDRQSENFAVVSPSSSSVILGLSAMACLRVCLRDDSLSSGTPPCLPRSCRRSLFLTALDPPPDRQHSHNRPS